MTDKPMRLRRSQLAVPGSSEKMLTKYNKTTNKESANKLMEAWKQNQ